MTAEQTKAALRASTEAQARVKRENAKHTAGPWTHEGQGDITGIENDPANGCVGPVDVCSVYLRTVPGRHEANARLIAAAPELLDALKACAGVCAGEVTTHSGLINALEKARAVMRKATGETHEQ